MHLLEAVATAEQKERYLRPLAAGDLRSCFAMTEPAPGAGSDPAALLTRAERVPGGWRIDGRKWFTTGADGAGFAICMARTSGAPGDRGGATMFLVDAANPGMRVLRHIETLDESLSGGHAEVAFDDCRGPRRRRARRGRRGVPVRPGAARPGAADALHALAGARAPGPAHRGAPGRGAGAVRLARWPTWAWPRQMIADNEIDIAASRGLIRQACWELDRGQPAAQSAAMAKVFTAEAVWRVVDRSLQLCGALGVSGDVLLGRFLREVRPFRIYDGPSETHRWAIAKRVVKAAPGSGDSSPASTSQPCNRGSPRRSPDRGSCGRSSCTAGGRTSPTGSPTARAPGCCAGRRSAR